MNSFTCLVLVGLVSASMAFPMYADQDDSYDYLSEEPHFFVLNELPNHRVRRQSGIDYNIGEDKNGRFGTLGGRTTAIDNHRHKLDVGGSVTKYVHGPAILDTKTDYLHKPTGFTGSLGTSTVQRYGTDVRAEVGKNLWQSNDGRSTLGANAFYERHYGGPFGTGRPNAGGFINFNHRF